MSKRLAFFGHVNIDVVLVTPDLHRQGSSEVTAVREEFGGTAGNFAIVASRIGVSFDLYGAISRSTHARYIEFLKSLGIDTSTLTVSDDTMGPICYIVTNRNDQIYYMHQGPMGSWSPTVSDLRRTDYDRVHFSTGPLDRYSVMASDISAQITFDPGQEINYRYSKVDIEAMISRSRILILNEYEMSLMTKILGRSESDIADACESVIVTQGQNGATLYTGGEIIHADSIPAASVKDTVGAGDSFRAGLYFGLQNGYDMADSVTFGQISASRSIETGIRDFDFDAGRMIAEFDRIRK